jgi:hypothetical protein
MSPQIFEQPAFFAMFPDLQAWMGKKVEGHVPSGPAFLTIAKLALAKLDFTDWTAFGRDQLRSGALSMI